MSSSSGFAETRRHNYARRGGVEIPVITEISMNNVENTFGKGVGQAVNVVNTVRNDSSKNTH